VTLQPRDEHFTVDAKLLRELGERLVGRPHIALAELIKNSYDADARLVEIKFHPDRIEVVDDGHGMSEADFVNRWLRIATAMKEANRRSPELGRQLTGSKGIGRLAAQVLARHMVITTRSLQDPLLEGVESRRGASTDELEEGVRAEVHWEDAVASRDLETVPVAISGTTELIRFAAGSRCGTRVLLQGLHSHWAGKDFRRLAEQIWHLQPPFISQESDAFEVRLEAKYQSVVDSFNDQMRAIFDIWSARIQVVVRDDDPNEAAFELPLRLERYGQDTRENEQILDAEEDGADLAQVTQPPPRLADLTIELSSGEVRQVTYRVKACHLQQLNAEIRVFDLNNRQPHGVSVALARRYLDQWGGVGIYDGGFRLPYYGADQDWLALDIDSARRLSASALVPEKLAVDRGMQDLPSSRRVFGQVRVSTTDEAAQAKRLGYAFRWSGAADGRGLAVALR
jgi:hypothetical protein